MMLSRSASLFVMVRLAMSTIFSCVGLLKKYSHTHPYGLWTELTATRCRGGQEERNGMRGDPDREEKTWLDELAETNRMRSGYQELAAKAS